jgi:hypothetical protein
VRLYAAIALTLCSGCNALTGVSDLEPVDCVDCVDSALAADTGSNDSNVTIDTTAPDTMVSMEDAAALCANGSKDPAEGDVDCGGPCGKCSVNKTCNVDSDCTTDHCAMGKCASCPADMVMVAGASPSSHYCIDIRETTNAEYKAWLDTSPVTTGQPDVCAWNMSFAPTTSWPTLATTRPTHPVRYVDWCDALAYCTAKKKRLCGKIGGGSAPYTSYADAAVDEWFRACSVAGARTYPYGTTIDIDKCNAKDSGYSTTVAAGALMACTNPYGTFDMSGNVSEWEDCCGSTMGATDVCRHRGGSYMTADARCSISEFSQRQSATEWTGIRCCDD